MAWNRKDAQAHSHAQDNTRATHFTKYNLNARLRRGGSSPVALLKKASDLTIIANESIV